MLPDKLNLQIVTPERGVLTESVDEVIVPSVEGYMGVRPGHAPLLAMLDIGEISYRIGSQDKYLACSGGFVEVLADSVAILAKTAEPAESIDLDRARQAQQRAEERLKSPAADLDAPRAEVSLRKAIARIQTHSHI